jgi:hypothetical protein
MTSQMSPVRVEEAARRQAQGLKLRMPRHEPFSEYSSVMALECHRSRRICGSLISLRALDDRAANASAARGRTQDDPI